MEEKPKKMEFVLGYRDEKNNFYSDKIEETFNKLKNHFNGNIRSSFWSYDHKNKLSAVGFDGNYIGFISHMENSNFFGMPNMILGEIQGKIDKQEYRDIKKIVEELGYQIDKEPSEMDL